ncbi:GntR family transcriptional regulator [Streptomyces sp. AC555_RSS877]|uniref:GntR family transcriptional regulator n=1 Tax=Streptomyces sp. AC555_RSS877 TaxID=2823688 RepID=UPI0020B69C8B|nr:GntR family transcriptional regulator [Streptomyces sp. AC555_RSS877]
MAVRQPTLRGIPRKSPLGGYLYVIRFSIDVIKVGMSVSPAGRVRAHYGYSTGLGIPVTDLWISEPHEHAERNETQLIKFCCANAEQVNAREYFVGLGFSDVVRHAKTLPYVPAQCSTSAHDIPNAMRWRQTYDALRERIADGTYPPGQRLPSGLAICDEFGISPVTAKRVLTELRKAGLAEMQVGIGTFVTELPQPEG